MNAKGKAIKMALKSFGSTMRPSKKAAPGIDYAQLSPKEKFYRKSNETRTHAKIKKFESSGYGKHLADRERRRGEQNL